MAITDTQKLDYLWKKVGYAVTKTDVNSIKAATNESIPSPLLLRADKVWQQSASIPGVLPANSTAIVQVYRDSPGSDATQTVECTEDLTSSARRTWRTGATDWIPPEFGSTYQLRVYVDVPGSTTPQTTGTQLFAAGSNNNDEWFFDYQSGTLNFIGTNLPSQVIAGRSIYVAGARYIGTFGVGSGTGGGGTTYTAGNGIAISAANVISVNANAVISVGGVITTGNVTAGNITLTETLRANNLVISNASTTSTLTVTGNASAGNIAVTTNVAVGNTLTANVTDIALDSIFRSNLQIVGNLIVTGNTIQNQLSNAATDQLLLIVANNAPTIQATNGAGLLVFSANASLTYDQPNNRWFLNRALNVDGSITPNVTGAYDLGSTDNRFGNLYLTGNVISANGGGLTTSGNNVSLTTTTEGNVVISSNTGNTTVSSTGGNTVIQTQGTGDVIITSNTDAQITAGDDVNITAQAGRVIVQSNLATSLTANTGDVTVTATTGNINLRSGTGNVIFSTNANVANIGLVSRNTTHWGNLDVRGAFTVNGLPVSASGVSGTIGTPTDSTYNDGAYRGFDGNTSVADAVDILNEVINNVRNNTFVRSVTFTGTPTSGGAGANVTLSMTPDGNANRYDIDWGDGQSTIGATTTSVSHIYTTNENSPYTVTVRAYNNTGAGSGSEASSTRTDYIQIFTGDPQVAFRLYKVAANGTALTGNSVYAIEGETIYLENATTNTANANVTYNIAWGDNSTTSVSSDSQPGGVTGTRAPHLYGTGTNSGTGTRTINLTLLSHSTADQTILPVSANANIKIYNPGIAAPNGLSTKSIAFQNSVGTSPKLAFNFANIAGASANLVAGSAVNRTVANTGNITSTTTATPAYNANAGVISAIVNGVADGNITLTTADNSGTNLSVEVVAESDYGLLDANGAAVSFANSIYHPGLYRGFTARVNKNVAQLDHGLHTFYLSHSTTGNTAPVQFVRDNLTVVPTVTSGNVVQVSGTYRYISGVPYYNTPTNLRITGATIRNLTGQTYTDSVNPLQVWAGVNSESTTGNVIADGLSYSFAQIDGVNTMLDNGIPFANVGAVTAYSIGNITVPITSSAVRAVQTIGIKAVNVNGVSTQANANVRIAVHTATQSGVNEISTSVNGLGNGVYTDAARRSFALNAATSDTPAFVSATNYYTAALYTEGSDPGVAGTREATIRWGNIQHDVTNYSVNFLPVGPDRSGDTGTQYATFVLRRQVVSNFSITISSGATGVAGVWIAAPGTAIDTASSLNGWLDCGAAYAGSGVPGANTGSGGNGSNGCAATTGDRIVAGTQLNGTFNMTLGSENLTNATGNCLLVRIALNAGQRVSGLSFGA